MTNSKVTPRSKAAASIATLFASIAGIANVAAYRNMPYADAYAGIINKLEAIREIIRTLDDEGSEEVTLPSNSHIWTGDKW